MYRDLCLNLLQSLNRRVTIVNSLHEDKHVGLENISAL